MSASVPVLGVLVAAASAFVVGGLWYSPSLFLGSWLKTTGMTEDRMKKRFGPAMVLMIIGALLTAYVLAHFISYAEQATGTSGVTAGVTTALWAWLGLSLSTVIADGAMEDRSINLMRIQAGNRLVTLLIMGAILGALM